MPEPLTLEIKMNGMRRESFISALQTIYWYVSKGDHSFKLLVRDEMEAEAKTEEVMSMLVAGDEN